MKSSGKGSSLKKSKRHSKCLIVDGYNIIARKQGASLHNIGNLDNVRDELIDSLAQYRAYTGEHIIVVFDAHRTDDTAREHVHSGVHVLFTQKHETADDRIERLVYELRDEFQQITVATSDNNEQQVIFGGGALRIPAGEFIRRLTETSNLIRQNVSKRRQTRNSSRLGDVVDQDIMNILEKWRRQ